MNAKPSGFHRLQALRMENDAAGFEMEEMAPRFATLANRHENGTAPRAVSAYQLFQTPPALARRLVDCLELKAGARVLEPSAGLGRIIANLGDAGEIVAVEIAPQCSAELYRQEWTGVKIIQRDFLTVTPHDIGFFDAVAMNPPFHMRSDIRHILHALEFLRPGARLAALCLDTHHRAQALAPMADSWEHIPAGAFKSEGTQVPTVLLTITKK